MVARARVSISPLATMLLVVYGVNNNTAHAEETIREGYEPVYVCGPDSHHTPCPRTVVVCAGDKAERITLDFNSNKTVLACPDSSQEVFSCGPESIQRTACPRNIRVERPQAQKHDWLTWSLGIGGQVLRYNGINMGGPVADYRLELGMNKANTIAFVINPTLGLPYHEEDGWLPAVGGFTGVEFLRGNRLTIATGIRNINAFQPNGSVVHAGLLEVQLGLEWSNFQLILNIDGGWAWHPVRTTTWFYQGRHVESRGDIPSWASDEDITSEHGQKDGRSGAFGAGLRAVWPF